MRGLVYRGSWRRKIRKYDVVRVTRSVWDAPDYRLESYGGEVRNYRQHLVFEPDDEHYSGPRPLLLRIPRAIFPVLYCPGS